LKLSSLFITQESFTGYMGQASNLDSPNQRSAKETQFTLVPIPKKTRQYIYPESGFEARYERVNSY
jgi:hypothetical protein